jgi:hypothetical protein
MVNEFYLKYKDTIYKNVKKWQKENPERVKENVKRYNLKLKEDALVHYSNGQPKCACCGIMEPKFLSIDHIGGGGNKHRRELNIEGGTSTYRWLRKNNYPDGFRVLCFNCNMAIGFFGVCPHKDVL